MFDTSGSSGRNVHCSYTIYGQDYELDANGNVKYGTRSKVDDGMIKKASIEVLGMTDTKDTGFKKVFTVTKSSGTIDFVVDDESTKVLITGEAKVIMGSHSGSVEQSYMHYIVIK